jgi:4-amino-4-deoxy-L-arabinose transferase-like glycosyltransferase
VVAVGFFLRLYTLGSESLWFDELLELEIASGPLALLISRLRIHTALPLDYLLIGLWTEFGQADTWVRLPAVLLGTLTLPLAFQLGRRMFGSTAGLLFMVLLAVSPFHIQFSQEVRPYALVVLGTILITYGLWRLRHGGGWGDWLILQLGVIIAVLAHIFAGFVMAAMLAALAIDFGLSRDRRQVMRVAGLLLLASVPLLLVFWLMGWLDVLYYTTRQFGFSLAGPATSGMAPAGPAAVVEEWRWSTWLFQKILTPLTGFSSAPVLFLGLGLAFLGACSLFARRQWRAGLYLLLWLLIPPLLIVPLLFSRDTFFAARYIITTLPAYLLLVATGLLAIPNWLVPARFRRAGWAAFGIAIGIILFTTALELNHYYHTENKEDWRLVSNFIRRNAGPADAVIAPGAESAINWYLPAAYVEPGHFSSLETIQAAVAASDRSWVILSIFNDDQNPQIVAWLSEQQAVRLALDPVIHVYYVGHNTAPDQLLAEIQAFALPVDHELYASLARENRHRPQVARQYLQLAVDHAPDSETRAAYEEDLENLSR